MAKWIDHLHRAHSIDELEHLQVIIGAPLPTFPHLTHSPEPLDLPAAAIHFVPTPNIAEETVLELYGEEVALEELAVAVSEIANKGRLPRQEVAGQMGAAELPVGEEQIWLSKEQLKAFLERY